MKRRSYKFLWDEDLGRLVAPPDFDQVSTLSTRQSINQVNEIVHRSRTLHKPATLLRFALFVIVVLGGFAIGFLCTLYGAESLGALFLCITPFLGYAILALILKKNNRVLAIQRWADTNQIRIRMLLHPDRLDFSYYFTESS